MCAINSYRFNRDVGRYEAALHPAHEVIARDAMRIVGVGAGDKVLDVAAGPGALAIPAAMEGADVTAVDLNPDMVDRLTERAKSLGLDNFRAQVMNGEALDLEDESFDSAFSVFGINLFPDRAAGLRELCRVLKRGGIGGVVAWAAAEKQRDLFLLRQAAIDVHPASSKIDNFDRLQSMEDPELMKQEMLVAGFSRVNVFTVKTVRTFRSIEDWFDDSPAGGVFAEIMTEDERSMFRNSYLATLREEQGEGPYALSIEANIAVGVK